VEQSTPWRVLALEPRDCGDVFSGGCFFLDTDIRDVIIIQT
jgi:hypothetical protein